MDQLPVCRLHIYNCLKVLLEIELDESRDNEDFTVGLDKLYGPEYVSICRKILNGTEVFHGLHSPGLSLDGFEEHNKLLECYKKLHNAKKNNWSK
jgi:ribosomal protein S12 methylthiotransferase accessory factor